MKKAGHHAHIDGNDGLIRAFCEARDIAAEPEGRERTLLVSELQKGYPQYVSRAPENTAEFDTLEVEEGPRPALPRVTGTPIKASSNGDALRFAEVKSRYFGELDSHLSVSEAAQKKIHHDLSNTPRSFISHM